MLGCAIGLGAVGGAELVLTERSLARTNEQQFQDRLVFGSVVLLGGILALSSLHETPVEQMHDLWVHDPNLSRMPRFDVSVGATHGGMTFGLSGRF
jgi:hypothetical protein